MARKSAPKKAETLEKTGDVFADTLATLQKEHGREAVIALDGSTVQKDINVISTGSLALDRAIGVGGLPTGRIVEIYGGEGAGKTLITLHVIRNAQRQGHLCGFVDAEHALDLKWARKMGVDVDKLLFSQPDNGEQALEIAESMVRSGAIKVVVIDSVAALVPRAELEGDMGQAQMGLQARLMSQAMRKLTGAVLKHDVLIIFINQLRKKIGVMFGSPDTTTGGEALKYYSSVRLDVRKIGRIERRDEVIGHRTKVRVVKNKVAVPYQEAEFDSYWGIGFMPAADLLDIGVESDVIKRAGAHYKFNDIALGMGREEVVENLTEDTELFTQILQAVDAVAVVPTAVEVPDAIEAPSMPSL